MSRGTRKPLLDGWQEAEAGSILGTPTLKKIKIGVDKYSPICYNWSIKRKGETKMAYMQYPWLMKMVYYGEVSEEEAELIAKALMED